MDYCPRMAIDPFEPLLNKGSSPLYKARPPQQKGYLFFTRRKMPTLRVFLQSRYRNFHPRENIQKQVSKNLKPKTNNIAGKIVKLRKGEIIISR